MLLKELTEAQSVYAEDWVHFIVNDEKLTVETFKKYRDCYVISWEMLLYTDDGSRVMNVIVEVLS